MNTIENLSTNPSPNPSSNQQEEPLFTQYTPRQQPRLRPKSPRATVLSVGLGADDLRKLRELQGLLSGGSDDAPSASLVVRAAVSEYLVRLLGIKSNPQDLDTERHRLAHSAKRIIRGAKRRKQSHRA